METLAGRPSPYAELLDAAYTLGRADGRLARDFEPAGTVDPVRSSCRGRDPAEFAALLCRGRPGPPPSGLELNAPRWYLCGFAEGLAEPVRTTRPCPIPLPRVPEPVAVRRPRRA